jgi:alkylresorcinol/alkylpyrone synthase
MIAATQVHVPDSWVDAHERRRRPLTRDVAAIAGSATVLPDHRYDQATLARAAASVLGVEPGRAHAIERFFENVGVRERFLALPLERYLELETFGQRNDAWIEVAQDLGARAIRAALEEAGLAPRDVGMLVTTTVTGIAVPSLDARLMNVLPFSPAMKRMPLFGLGCLGGAAGLARAAEYLRAFPDECVVLLSVELCSLTFQRGDGSVANLIATGLFGDGAAAVVLRGPRHLARTVSGAGGVEAAEPRVVASESVFFPDTERVMGWDIDERGFHVVLSADVPRLVEAEVPRAVDGFLARHGLTRADMACWVVHPGGPKVITALTRSLGLAPDALAATRETLASVGNLSSASVLFLLDEHRRGRAPAPGEYGVLMAMGPAFCAEMVLLQW